MKRASRNAAEAKQKIIKKSALVFNEFGYSGTKMQMLVNATGYQFGGIYHHFNTKKELAKDAFQHNYEVLIKPNWVVNKHLNPKEKLLNIFKNYEKMVLKPCIAGGCPILNTATEMDDTDEEFRVLTLSFVDEIITIIEQILEEGKATGFFRTSVEPKKDAYLMFASLEGAIMLASLTKNLGLLRDILEKILAYFEDEIFQDPS